MGLFDSIGSALSGADEDIWNSFSTPADMQDIVEQSKERPQLIYKHSNRCSVCFISKGNLEQGAENILEHADMHYLNVVKNRPASDRVASQLNVRHESPQVLLLDDEEVIWHASHGSIDVDVILDKVAG